MTVYILILISSSIFSFCYSKSKEMNAQVVFLILCFMSLFLPAALRYGIGADYFNYYNIYDAYERGIKIADIEPFMIIIMKVLQKFRLSYYALVVVYAFLTNLFIFLGIPKDKFYVGIPMYVLIFYLETFCVLRQIMGACIMFYAYSLYVKSKYKSSIFWSIIAFSSHRSMIIPIALMFLSELFPYVSNRRKNFLYILFFGFMYVFSSQLINFVFQVALGSSTYAHYAMGVFGARETEVGSGLGVLLKLFCISLFGILIDRESMDKKEYKITLTLLFCYLTFYFFAMKIYIMQRLICSIYFCFIFFIISSFKSRFRYRKYCVIFLFAVYTLLFYTGTKGAKVTSVRGASGRRINPYISVFNYNSNDLIKRWASNFGY